jgi:hypothetical protein
MEDFENSAILTHVPGEFKQQIVFKLKSIVDCVMRGLGIGTRVNTRTGPNGAF